MTVHVLAQSDAWVVVAKPPLVLVHRNAENPDTDVMLQRVRNHVKRHVYAIHRLDYQASGCLLFATQREAAGPLSAALADASARKTYAALVRGQWGRGEEPVDVNNPMKDEREVLKEARTRVWCVGASPDPRCSLLLAQPETGRWHQVRRHVRDLNHPIVGDTKHGDSRINREWRENRGMRRLALHNLQLDLPDPAGGRITVECPLFDDMAAVLRALPFWDEAVRRVPLLGREPIPC